MIKLKQIDPESLEFRELVDKLDKLMYELYDKYLEEGDNLDAYLDDYTVLCAPGVFCVGAYKDNKLVGIGAIKDLITYHELKRIFVTDSYRGCEIGAKIVQALEEHAGATRTKNIKLETGIEQPAAIHLFKKLKYVECEHYGDYENHPANVFMQKYLN